MRVRLPAALTAGVVAVAVAVALLTAPMADAQNWRRPPAFGAVTLYSGFTPDPFYRDLTAGGTIDAGRVLGGACVGSIANAPDFRMNYSAGSYPLTIYVQSFEDTTLIVNTPDGNWYCNDDWDGLDPGLSFDFPMSGQYDIWVGTYNPGRGIPARLFITELN